MTLYAGGRDRGQGHSSAATSGRFAGVVANVDS